MVEANNPQRIPQPSEVTVRDWSLDGLEETDRELHEDEASYWIIPIEEYVKTLASKMGLGHWDIFITKVVASEGTMAEVHPVFGRRVAQISISKKWRNYSPEEQRNTLVHELIHILHTDQTEVIRVSTISNSLMILFNRETELLVDHLANLLAPLFPLPTPKEEHHGL